MLAIGTVRQQVHRASTLVERMKVDPKLKPYWDVVRKASHYRPDLAEERLAEWVAHCVQSVPRYFGPVASDRHTVQDFPVTTKRDLINAPFEYLSRNERGELGRGRYVISRTSGSSGQPVTTIRTVDGDGLADNALTERLYRQLDITSDPTILDLSLGNSTLPLVQALPFPRPHLRVNLRAYDQDSADVCEDYRSVLGHVPCDLIRGTSSRLVALARYCEKNRIIVRPRAVIGSYEHMPTAARTYVESVFDARVTMLYGTGETGIIGWECNRRRYHVQDDFAYVEVVDTVQDRGSGESIGRLIVTSLKSKVMPILRYDTGDLCAPIAPCGCGLSGPTTARLVGRAGTSLVGQSGSTYSPYALLEHLGRLGVVDHQIVQQTPGVLEIRVGPECQAGGAAVARLGRHIAARLGDDSELVMHLSVMPFIVTDAGKRNPVIQRLEVPGISETVITDYLTPLA